MGRKNKKKEMISWLLRVNNTATLFTRKHMSIQELFELYLRTNVNITDRLNIISFGRIINSIVTNKLCENLKRKQFRSTTNRSTRYILVQDSEIHLDYDDIKVHITRRLNRKKPINEENTNKTTSTVEVQMETDNTIEDDLSSTVILIDPSGPPQLPSPATSHVMQPVITPQLTSPATPRMIPPAMPEFSSSATNAFPLQVLIPIPVPFPVYLNQVS